MLNFILANYIGTDNGFRNFLSQQPLIEIN